MSTSIPWQAYRQENQADLTPQYKISLRIWLLKNPGHKKPAQISKEHELAKSASRKIPNKSLLNLTKQIITRLHDQKNKTSHIRSCKKEISIAQTNLRKSIIEIIKPNKKKYWKTKLLTKTRTDIGGILTWYLRARTWKNTLVHCI